MHGRTKYLALAGMGLASLAIVAFLVTSGSASTNAPSPDVLTKSATGFQDNVVLSVPPDELTAKVSSDAAVSTALNQLGTEGATASQVTFASFSWDAVPVDKNDNPTGPPLYDGVPAWVVRVSGPCAELVPETGVCTNSQMYVVIDATSGKALLAYPADGALDTTTISAGS